MAEEDIANIGRALWRIAQLLDSDTFNKVKPSLEEIQYIVLKYRDTEK